MPLLLLREELGNTFLIAAGAKSFCQTGRKVERHLLQTQSSQPVDMTRAYGRSFFGWVASSIRV